ncbi:hypothetical protein [Litorimonas sp.]|uniref:hypothetical protein n=1 Tax=Litorimonas sp. TaxID=1892381 RepID=UPI003A87EE6F
MITEVTNKIVSLVRESVDQYDGPFIAEPSDAFLNASPKILYVGQEAFGWSPLSSFKGKESLVNLRNHYNNFDYGVDYSRSPFWNFHRKIIKRFNLCYQSVLWTNLSKFSMSKTKHSASILRSPYVQEIISYQQGLLTQEVIENNINIILFITGPNYDWIIQQEFPDAKFIKTSNNFPCRQLAQVVLPEHSNIVALRTYHPKYLRLKNLEDTIISEIYKSVQSLIG